MKTGRILFLIIFVSSLSCTINDIKYREAANMNYLTIGPYDIGIDKRFTLVGDIDSRYHSDNIDDPKGTNFDVKQYIFADTSNGKNNVSKMIIVMNYQMKDPHHYFLGDAEFKRENNTFAVGRTQLGDVKVAYKTIKVKTLPAYILKFGKDHGYSIALSNNKYGTAVIYGKNTRSRQIQIQYAEMTEDDDVMFSNSKKFITFSK